MAYCIHCGNQIQETDRFCCQCGAKREVTYNQQAARQWEQAPAQPKGGGGQQATQGARLLYEPPTYTLPGFGVQPQQAAQTSEECYAQANQPKETANIYGNNMQTPAQKREKPAMGMGAYLGALLLMMLPFAGIVIALVWACGGTENKSKRDLAQALLIIYGILIIIAMLLGLLMPVLAFQCFLDAPFAPNMPRGGRWREGFPEAPRSEEFWPEAPWNSIPG